MSDVREAGPDPLAPIDFVVSLMSALIAVLFCIAAAATVFGSGSIFGFGDPSVCVQVDNSVVPFGGSDGPGGFHVVGLRQGASWFPAELRLCPDEAGAGLRVAAAAGQAASFSLLLGFLVITRLLIRSVRRSGLFSRQVAARARQLGWFLLLGGLGAPVLDAAGRGIVTASAVDHVSWTDALYRMHVPWAVVIAGVGVVTFSRVLRQAVDLQDEVDATI